MLLDETKLTALTNLFTGSVECKMKRPNSRRERPTPDIIILVV